MRVKKSSFTFTTSPPKETTTKLLRVRTLSSSSSSTTRMRREIDAEAELNLPPGFRFHPTDEELIVHYLCRKVSYQNLPVPIIAEVDLYKYNPWQLPEKALFGTKEWYFFSPRDRKYPNGLRPNRAAGSGYWKATGADKPIRPTGSARHVGIKKALVFYSGKAPKGVKTNWIMHEYRLAEPNQPSNKKGSLRLDGWVLCRIYNKKNNWENNKEEQSLDETMDSFDAIEDMGSDSIRTPESGIDNEPLMEQNYRGDASQALVGARSTMTNEEDNEWYMGLDMDDLQNSLSVFGPIPIPDSTCQDYYFSGLASPHLKPYQTNLLPF